VERKDGAAERIAGQVIPALGPLLGLRKPPAAAPGPSPGPRNLGAIRHRTLTVIHTGATVRIAWGDTGPETVPAAPPSLSLRRLVPPGERPPERFGAFWPGKLELAPTLGTPLAATLAEAAPIIWSGRGDPAGAREVLRLSGLRDLVHHLLERLPAD
jgi:hypothetical protein